jgi:hypothetical protein
VAWEVSQAEIKRKADEKAAKDREAEQTKATYAKEALAMVKQGILDFEMNGARRIIDARDRPALINFWKDTLKPFEPSTVPEELRPEAEAMKNRLVELGKFKDALFEAETKHAVGTISADHLNNARGGWAQQRAKYSSLASTAAAVINEKVAEVNSNIDFQTEVKKSEITTAQLANVPEKNISTRKTWKYRVTDITMVPAALTMTVINDDAVNALMTQYKDKIEAGEQGIAGIEFYAETTAINR